MNAKRVSGPRRGPPGLIIAGATEDFGAAHHGSVPFPGSLRPPPTVGARFRAAVPAAIVLVPFAGLAAAVWLAWGHGLGLADVLLALGFYVLTGLGVSVRFHRLLRHRSFTAGRPPPLAVAGSMSFEGDVNLWPLALVSFGESWHNMHHSDPVCARHGAGRGQMDISAGLIRIFEHLGWATGVRWPDPGRLAAHRRGSRQDQLRPVPQTAETAAASAARDDLIAQRQTTRAYTATAWATARPAVAISAPRAAAAGTGCTLPHPSRRQARRNHGTASPPHKLLPVHPPQQKTHEKGSASCEYRQEDRAQGRSS